MSSGKKVTIEQKGRFFTYSIQNDNRLPKLGVFEKVYLNGEFAGWKAHMVDTKFDHENYLFNFNKIRNNKVIKFEITYTESGFDPNEPTQNPRVEYSKGTRIK